MCVLRHVPTQSMPYEGTTDSSTIAVDTAFLGRRRPLQRSVDNRCGYPGLNLRMTHTGTNEAGWHKTHRPCRRCRVRVTFPTAITGQLLFESNVRSGHIPRTKQQHIVIGTSSSNTRRLPQHGCADVSVWLGNTRPYHVDAVLRGEIVRPSSLCWTRWGSPCVHHHHHCGLFQPKRRAFCYENSA